MSQVLKNLLKGESAAGVLLLLSAVISFLIANSPWRHSVEAVWDFHFAGMSVLHWLNDGLMAVFFLSVGLEIKRELVEGALSTRRKAALPACAAIGGMVAPALLYLMFNHSAESRNGWGVPMATDIAFVAGVLSLLGRRVLPDLKVLVVSLAVVDDIGAIVVIALFYSLNFQAQYLFFALITMLGLAFMASRGVRRLAPYLLGGILLWWLTYSSGIHASVSGVVLAMTIPLEMGHWLEKKLHPVVGFGIMPAFALANAGVYLSGGQIDGAVFGAVVVGLCVGKPLGIVLSSWLATTLRWAELPAGVSWMHVIGIGCLSGIGFTMSLFMAHLSLQPGPAVDSAILAVLCGSLISGVVGVFLLKKAPLLKEPPSR